MKMPAHRLLLPLLSFAVASVAHAQPAATCQAEAIETIEALARHDHGGARRYLDATLVANSQQMEAMWDALVQQNWGPYRSHGEAEATANGDRTTTVRLPLQFEHGQTTATLTCDPKQSGAIVEFSLL